MHHYFSVQKNIPDPNDLSVNLKKTLGDEIDIMYKYKTEIPVELRIGIALFNANRTMEVLQGVDGTAAKMQFFSYLQLAFTPEIFSSKN